MRRARERAPGRVELDRRRGRQSTERIHAQVLLADQPRAHRVEDSSRGVAAALGQRPDERPPSRFEPLDAAASDPALGRSRVAQKPVEVHRAVPRVQRRQRLALDHDRPQQQPLGFAPERAAGGFTARAAGCDPRAHHLQVGVQFGLVRGHRRAVQAGRAVERGRHAQRLERHHVGGRARHRLQRRMAGDQLPARRDRERRQVTPASPGAAR